MADEPQPQTGRLIGTIAIFALLGTPLVAFLWETLNRLMAGWLDPIRIAISIPAFIVLYVLLRYLARVTQRIAA
jgi:hypothetical protein